MDVPSPFPHNFGLGLFEGHFALPDQLSHVPMGREPTLLNGTYQEAMQGWHLPAPEIFDSMEDGGLDETAQSQNEIVQKSFIFPKSSDLQQHELLFAKKNDKAIRNFYTNRDHAPSEVDSLTDLMRIICGKDKAGNDYTVKNIVEIYNPLGACFNFVGKSAAAQTIAYACGGLVDILNMWQTHLLPGMGLFLVLHRVPGMTNLQITPYANLCHPKEDTAFMTLIKSEQYSFAVLNVGILCVGNGRHFLQGGPYLTDHDKKPRDCTHFDSTKPLIQGNVLRVKMNALKWDYFDV